MRFALISPMVRAGNNTHGYINFEWLIRISKVGYTWIYTHERRPESSNFISHLYKDCSLQHEINTSPKYSLIHTINMRRETHAYIALSLALDERLIKF